MKTLYTKGLFFEKRGPIKEVLQLGKVSALSNNLKLKFLKKDESGLVKIKVIASPINPSDINKIEGSYPIKQINSEPYVPGAEGSGYVIKSNSSYFKEGDVVISAVPGIGWWREEIVCEDLELFKISDKLDPKKASLLFVNPPTSFCLISNFLKLQKDDWIIQSGSNSTVGLYLIQLCKYYGINSINVLRGNERYSQNKELVEHFGGTIILKYEDLIDNKVNLSEIPSCEIGFDCVSGSIATKISDCLKSGSTLVCYGGMSKKPFTMKVSNLIFRDIKVEGFWMSRWFEKHQGQKTNTLLKEIESLFLNSILVFPEVDYYSKESWKDIFFSNNINIIFGKRKKNILLF